VSKNHYLGFDIGGTAIKYAIGSPGTEPLLSASIPTPMANLKAFIASFHQLIDSLMHEYRHLPIKGIGIATPGTIDMADGLLKGVNPNLPWWVNISALEVVPPQYRALAVCDNDANLMALAEAHRLSGSVLGITVGTGIGSGFVIDGNIYHGSRGFALELGHICVQRDGLDCKCGLEGCLEAYSSVTAIRKAAAKHGAKYADCSLTELILDAKRNELMRIIITRGRDSLVMGLATACMILDPDFIVLGGGGIDAGLYDISEIEAGVKAGTSRVNHHTKIIKATMGNQAGVMGAMLLAAQTFTN
jgi:glucokinase